MDLVPCDGHCFGILSGFRQEMFFYSRPAPAAPVPVCGERLDSTMPKNLRLTVYGRRHINTPSVFLADLIYYVRCILLRRLIYSLSHSSRHLTGVYLSCRVCSPPPRRLLCVCGCVQALFVISVFPSACVRVCVCTNCASVSALSDAVFDMTRGDLPSVFSVLSLSWHVEPGSLLSW